jgi:hypothetical protein
MTATVARPPGSPLALALALVCAAGCAAGPARHRVGDFVVYRYAGPALAEPVTLRQEVVAQEGRRLRIDFTATRKSGQRSWVQVVEGAARDLRGGAVEALYEKVEGRYVRLANRRNRDLFRLWVWTYFRPDKAATDLGPQPCQAEIAGALLACTCGFEMTAYKGASVRVKQTFCPDFVWTRGPSDAWPEEGEPVYTVDVVEHGRREDATPQPLAP